MALVAVQRNSSSTSSSLSSSKAESEIDMLDDVDGAGSLSYFYSSSSRTSKERLKQRSVSENFFAMPGAALILPKHSTLIAKNLQNIRNFGGELQTHLHAIFHHLRAQDNIKLAVRLESWDQKHCRYLVIVSTMGRQDTEESIMIGCDFETKDSTSCTIGLVLPLWSDTVIKLDGDGGFRIENREKRAYAFKPVSVQAMWSALQSLHRCVDVARRNHYYEGSLYLTWTCYYTSKILSERIYLNEWNYQEPVSYTFRVGYFTKSDPKRIPVEKLITKKLKAVMMDMDLDKCTSRQIRQKLEGEIAMDLKDYKQYIDTEMLNVLGQMDCSSKILDYLYLGSEWNASNLEELEGIGITHILNVTIEVDNYYPDSFTYKSVRLYDEPESILLPHWNHTWRFIEEAKKCGGKCLVHCKMGISRSSATVCAYLMKHRLWNKNKALEFVKSCRPIISPNSGFLKQLDEYEGIIFASAQRHNKLFRSLSENSLSDSNINDDHTAPPLPIACGNHNDDKVTMTPGDFDLNRRLLDITNTAFRKIPRPKSWSPEEGRSPAFLNKYSNNHDLFLYKDFTFRYFRHPNFSEPVDCLMPSSGDMERNKKLREKRKNFCNKRAHLRRHTVISPPLAFAVLEELAFSEDSVFVHDGTVVNRIRRGKKQEEKSLRHPTKNQENRPNKLLLNSTPSLVFTKSPNHSGEVPSSGIEITTSIPVREIVAVIESPVDDNNILSKLTMNANSKEVDGNQFIKGHHKTASLPPGSFQVSGLSVTPERINYDDSILFNTEDVRNRSYSETQTVSYSVKKIVTAIESGNLYDSGGDEEMDLENIFSNTSAQKLKTSDASVKSLSEINADPSPLDSESLTHSDVSSPHQKHVIAWSANTNNNNACKSIEPVGIIPKDLAKNKEEKILSLTKRHPSLSPVMLRVIEKVGLQLMASSCRSSITSRSEDSTSNTEGSENSSTGRKRGVRHMVREIEKSVRRFRGKNVKSTSVSCPSHHLSSTPVISAPPVSSDSDSIFPFESPDRPDVRVRDLVGRFDASADESPASSPVKKMSFEMTNILMSSSCPSDHVTPPLYRKPKFHQQSPVDSSNLNRVVKSSVRRSHSDKINTRSSVTKSLNHSRSFQINRSNLSRSSLSVEQHKPLVDKSKNLFPLPTSMIILEKQSCNKEQRTKSPVVKEMVTNIEKTFSRSLSSSVCRSSSMPPSSASSSSSRVQRQLRHRLRKTKSTPFLTGPNAYRHNLSDGSD